MFDDLYYFGLNFIDQNGILLLVGAALCYFGYRLCRVKEYENKGLISIFVGGGILLWNGIFTLLYVLFFVALAIGIGFLLYAITTKK